MQKLYILFSFILQIIFVSSRSISSSTGDCKSQLLKQIKSLCSPIHMQTPCFQNTTFNSDTLIIEQVQDISLDLTADLCCMSMTSENNKCTMKYISDEICCKGNHCMQQCYGITPPFTDSTYSDAKKWKVVKNRGMKPPTSLVQAVLPKIS